jgi:hypothetical protein
MGRPIVDLTGKRFGRLVVSGMAEARPAGAVAWVCRCDCGGEKTVAGGNLKSGQTRSCGCMIAELLRTTTRPKPKHGHARRGNHSKTYSIWTGMRGRCHGEGPSRHQYAHYRDRGISVCPQWRNDYAQFLADMGQCPEGYSIDRIDTNGNYEPGNVRWVPIKEQQYNKRTNVFVEYEGDVLCLSIALERAGIKADPIYKFMKAGLTRQEAFDKAVEAASQRAFRVQRASSSPQAKGTEGMQGHRG